MCLLSKARRIKTYIHIRLNSFYVFDLANSVCDTIVLTENNEKKSITTIYQSNRSYKYDVYQIKQKSNNEY